MSNLLDKLLKYFNITLEGYNQLIAEPSFSNVPTLNNDDINVKKAKEIVISAVRSHKKIIIYGDYDCDGIMSTSIISKSIRLLGGECSHYIPSRYIDGYGITVENAKKIALANYDLVILVDNGITAYEGIEELKKNNIEVLIIDHHEIKDKLPDADVILHPSILNYGQYAISAGYLSFLFSIILLNLVDDYLLCLGALSTISDMMPLKSYNREIVRLSIDILNKKQYPAFTILGETTKFDSNLLGLTIIPCINAIGRMVEDTTVNRLVSYFVEEDIKKISSISAWMKCVNQERKDLTKNTCENLSIRNEDYGIVVVTDIKVGLNGLLANILLQKYKKPVVVFSKSALDSSILVGSIRTLEGLSAIDCFSELSSILLSSGGHSFAGGLSIKATDLDLFTKYFNKFCFNHPLVRGNDDFIEIEEDDISKNSCELINSFGPFGIDWKEPKLLFRNQDNTKFSFIKDGKYLCYYLDNSSKVISFSISKDICSANSSLDLIGSIKINSWKNTETVEFVCNKFEEDIC